MHDALADLTAEGMKIFGNLHYAFHEAIVNFSDNALLIKFFGELNLIKRASFIKSMTLEDLVRTENEHRKIIAYIRNRDPLGEDFIIQHLHAKIDKIKNHYDRIN